MTTDPARLSLRVWDSRLTAKAGLFRPHPQVAGTHGVFGLGLESQEGLRSRAGRRGTPGSVEAQKQEPRADEGACRGVRALPPSTCFQPELSQAVFSCGKSGLVALGLRSRLWLPVTFPPIHSTKGFSRVLLTSAPRETLSQSLSPAPRDCRCSGLSSEHPACLVPASPAFALGSGDTSCRKSSPAQARRRFPLDPHSPRGPAPQPCPRAGHPARRLRLGCARSRGQGVRQGPAAHLNDQVG